MVNAFAIAITFIFLFTTSPYISYASEIYVKNETLGMLGEGLKLIQTVSTKQENKIINNIKIRVPIDPAPVRVWAFQESGNRVIEISTGYSAVSGMIVAGYLIELNFNKENFGEKYARYTANTYATGRLGGGIAPWDKAGLSQSEQDFFHSDPNYNAQFIGQSMVVLWYVLAHEIAHHVLNHKFEKSIPLSKIREQEKEADLWASNKFIKLGIPPATAFPAFMYWYYLDEYGVKNEYRRTHPPDLKRLRSMLQKTIREFDIWNSNIKHFGAMPKKETIEIFNRLLFHTEELIAEQTKFDQKTLSSNAFNICMEERYKLCLQSCQKRYGNPLSLCKSKLCNADKSEKTKKIWTLRCSDSVN